jgi:hypothetical protein
MVKSQERLRPFGFSGYVLLQQLHLAYGVAMKKRFIPCDFGLPKSDAFDVAHCPF